LCATSLGRETLRSKAVYQLLRELDKATLAKPSSPGQKGGEEGGLLVSKSGPEAGEGLLDDSWSWRGVMHAVIGISIAFPIFFYIFKLAFY